MKRAASILLFFVCVALTLNAQPPHFQHIIVIVQENRTPDNLFQGLCSPPYGSSQSCSIKPDSTQYNIQTSNWYDASNARGYTQPTAVPLASDYDMGHSYTDYQRQCNNAFALNTPCRMDGATRVSCIGNCPAKPAFRYVDNSAGILNPYLDLATQYGFANYMFQTNQGPSFPAHLYLFAGTSAPSAAQDAQAIFASENVPGLHGGCTMPMDTLVQLIVPPGIEDWNNRVYPCFELQTMGDFEQTYSWKYYTPNATYIWTAPTVISHICQSTGYGGECAGQQFTDNVDLRPADVLTDISSCNLRNVSWVIPTDANSDHAWDTDGGGPSWVASIVNAVGNANSCDDGAGYWTDTAILITWDDWGGWYDHEVPPRRAYPFSDYELGFRVPLIVVSAYTPAAYIDNQAYDFGSMLRFIQQNFGVAEGILGFADARAQNDLTSFFRQTQKPRPFKFIFSPKDANFFINDKRPQGDPDDD